MISCASLHREVLTKNWNHLRHLPLRGRVLPAILKKTFFFGAIEGGGSTLNGKCLNCFPFVFTTSLMSNAYTISTVPSMEI